jgi:hypothetical protein
VHCAWLCTRTDCAWLCTLRTKILPETFFVGNHFRIILPYLGPSNSFYLMRYIDFKILTILIHRFFYSAEICMLVHDHSVILRAERFYTSYKSKIRKSIFKNPAGRQNPDIIFTIRTKHTTPSLGTCPWPEKVTNPKRLFSAGTKQSFRYRNSYIDLVSSRQLKKVFPICEFPYRNVSSQLEQNGHSSTNIFVLLWAFHASSSDYSHYRNSDTGISVLRRYKNLKHILTIPTKWYSRFTTTLLPSKKW